MKPILLISSALLACSAAAYATPVDEMVKQGFACDTGGHGQVVCRKGGAPSKVCNAEGSCFRIVYDGGALNRDGISTGGINGGIRRAQPGGVSDN